MTDPERLPVCVCVSEGDVDCVCVCVGEPEIVPVKLRVCVRLLLCDWLGVGESVCGVRRTTVPVVWLVTRRVPTTGSSIAT